MSKTIYGRSSVNLTVDSLTFLSITANDINATNASITNIDGTNLTYTNGTFNTANVSSLNVSDINISQISFNTANVSTLNASQINAPNASITNTSITTISGTDLTFTNASINTSLNCCDIDAFRIQLSGSLESNGITNFGDLVQVGALNITGGTGLLDMNGKNISDAGIIQASTVNVSTVNASGINIDSIDLTTLNVSTGNISTGNISTGNITTGNITTVNSSTGNFSTVNASDINIDSIDLTTINVSTGNISTGNITTGNISTGNISTLNTSSIFSTGQIQSNTRIRTDQFVSRDITPIVVINSSNGSTTLNASSINCSFTTTMNTLQTNNCNASTGNFSSFNASNFTLSTLDLNTANISTANVSTLNISGNTNSSGSFTIPENQRYNFGANSYIENNGTNIQVIGQTRNINLVGQNGSTARSTIYIAGSITMTDAPVIIRDDNLDMNNNDINNVSQITYNFCRANLGSFGSTTNFNRSFIGDLSRINEYTTLPWNASLVEQLGEGLVVGQTYGNADILYTANSNTEGIRFLNTSNINGSNFNINMSLTRDANMFVRTSIDAPTINASSLNASTLTAQTKNASTLNVSTINIDTEFNLSTNFVMGNDTNGTTGFVNTNASIFFASNSSATPFTFPIFTLGLTEVSIGFTDFKVLNGNCIVSTGNLQSNDVRPIDAVNPYNAWNSFSMNTTSTGSTPPTFLWGQGVHIDKDAGNKNFYYSHNQIMEWNSTDKAFQLKNNNRAGQYEVEAVVQVRNPSNSRSNYCIGVAKNDDTDVGSPTEPRFGEELSGFSPFAIAYARNDAGMRTTLRAKRIMKIDDTTDRISINTYVANGSGVSLADTQNSQVFNTTIKFTFIGNYTLQQALYS